MGLAEVVGLLACPVCTQPLALEGSLVCPERHRFDVARSGYVNLAGSAPPRHADTAAMVAARSRFWARGHYAGIADALVAVAAPTAGTVLDCGAGPGHHLARVLSARPGAVGLALDVSPAAARRAARAHPRVGAVVADAWARLPVRDGALDLVLSVFAPRRPDELRRVLRPDGRLVTVTPTPAHLAQLRAELSLLDVPGNKATRLAETLGEHFLADGGWDVRAEQTWDADTVRDAVAMGPNAFHLAEGGLADRLAALRGSRTVTVAVQVSRWRPRA